MPSDDPKRLGDLDRRRDLEDRSLCRSSGLPTRIEKFMWAFCFCLSSRRVNMLGPSDAGVSFTDLSCLSRH